MKRSLPLAVVLLTAGCLDGIGVVPISPPAADAETAPTLSDLSFAPDPAGPGDEVVITFLSDQILDYDETSVLVAGNPATFRDVIAESTVSFSYEVTGDVADFNRDDVLDYVHTAKNRNGAPPMYVYLGVGTNGQGTGTFSYAGQTPTARFTWSMNAADLDEDGAIDVIAPNRAAGTGDNLGDATIGWGKLHNGWPTGAFDREAAVLADNAGHNVVAFADLDADGATDLLLGQRSPSPAVTVVRNASNDGRGVRTWEAHAEHAVGSEPRWLVVGDHNRDGVPDVAAACSGGTVELLLGNSDGTGPAGGRGDGTLGTASVVASGLSDPRTIANGDFDGDHILDLAVGTPDTVEILLGDGAGGVGDGTFTSGTAITGLGDVDTVRVADVDRDGHGDVFVLDNSLQRARLYLGDGAGAFVQSGEAAVSDREGAPYLVDLDADGTLDLVTGNRNQVFRVFPGSGTANLTE